MPVGEVCGAEPVAAKEVVLAAAQDDQLAVGRVEVEVAVKLGLVRLAAVPAVAAPLLRAEEPVAAIG